MSVDLRKAKAGDTVKFRCGGEAIIEKIGNELMEFKGLSGQYWYPHDRTKLDGQIDNRKYLMDIIEIIPEPFDWKEVRTGMAFKDINDNSIWCFAYKGPTYMIFFDPRVEWPHQKNSHMGFSKNAPLRLIRSPEHDIKIVE